MKPSKGRSMNTQEQIQKEPVKISITFPTNAYFMSGIRDFTLSMIRNMTQFSEQWAYRFQTVVDELCNNAIEYGSAPLSEIKLIFQYYPTQALEITVEDTGTGKSKLKAVDMQHLITERLKPNFPFMEIRGRGLAKIVAAWTDELEFTDIQGGGLRIRVKKNLNKETIQAIPAQTNLEPASNKLVLTI